MDGDDDFFEEDISPVPDVIAGQSKWQNIQNHPHFKKVIICLVALFVFIIICIVAVALAIAFSSDGDSGDVTTPNNQTSIVDESSGYYSASSVSTDSSYETSYYTNSIPDDSDCENYYGPEEEGWTYGVMVDLGSSGSRVSIFEWKDGELVQSAPQNGPPYWYMKQNPGVSSYIVPDEAAESLIPLLDYAEEKLNCVNANFEETPIFLFATAGLRLLPEVQSNAILNSIRALVKSDYSFQFEDNWAAILTGTEEAIYDWLTVQQIGLIHVDDESTSAFKKSITQLLGDTPTVGIIDMGGGSVEVTFDPLGNYGNAPDLSTLQNVTFNDEMYNVYGYSYLYYGHNEARKRVEQILIDNGEDFEAANPCSLLGHNNTVTAEDGRDWLLYGTGNYALCAELARSLFDKDCGDWNPCSFDETYQPPTTELPFVALDGLARVTNFFLLDDQPELSEIENSADTFCGTPYDEALNEYGDNPVDTLTLSAYCWEGVYAYTFLTKGLNFPSDSNQIHFVDQYFGVEVSWTLGAMVDQVATLENVYYDQ
mmetsp:Transcript_4343/g.5352  ORF Transcript_4343/g.5352 Transcript_4343/m.5352 type:complete len:540 (-) Transcript_4343:23-1642(-)